MIQELGLHSRALIKEMEVNDAFMPAAQQGVPGKLEGL